MGETKEGEEEEGESDDGLMVIECECAMGKVWV